MRTAPIHSHAFGRSEPNQPVTYLMTTMAATPVSYDRLARLQVGLGSNPIPPLFGALMGSNFHRSQ